MSELAVLVMAAGQGARFGACKSLALLDGKPLLQYVLEAARPVAGEHCYVVTGCYQREIQQVFPDVQLIHNVDWQRGLGYSIACGTHQLSDKYEHLLIVLADQVALTSKDLAKLCQAQCDDSIICAHYAGRNGVPALFPRRYFPELKALDADKGAKALLQSPTSKVTAIEMPNAAVDIDTPEQLHTYKP